MHDQLLEADFENLKESQIKDQRLLSVRCLPKQQNS